MRVKMKKYAFVIINTKRNKNFQSMSFRRVLIRYKRRDKNNVYHGTKFIDSDPYFKDTSRSHQYLFTDRYYMLTKTDNTLEQLLFGGKKRKYHTYVDAQGILTKKDPKEIAWEIEAMNDEDARVKFHSRKETRWFNLKINI